MNPSGHDKDPRAGVAERGAAKTARIPVKVVQPAERLRKPAWIRVRAPNLPRVQQLKDLIAGHGLHTVCQEASCPNIGECYSHGTATFMVMGELCTRRCPFCDVAHGRPLPLDEDEPGRLAEAVALMQLRYVVITSVDRDDLRDGGAAHFARCIDAVRSATPGIVIEVLVPDFRGRAGVALEQLAVAPPDVFNHNLETVPRLYRAVRPGADYAGSLRLLADFGARFPAVPTKSGIMVGLGETPQEVEQVMGDLRAHGVAMLTIGQYLQPGAGHLPVERYVHPDEFDAYREHAQALGFRHVASGPLVRSSYHADRQAAEASVL